MSAKEVVMAAAGGTSVTYVDDVFSTYLYTGNGSTQTITNGIDLAGKGGLVWVKGRSGATDHALYDTARGATKDLVSNSTAAETTQSTGLTAFSSTGFSIGALAKLNTNTATYASWTFRKAPKFFDVVTYTGNGVAGRNIPHNLGSVPGCIIIKDTTFGSTDWYVWHRSLPTGYICQLNLINAAADNTSRAFGTPTATNIVIGTQASFNNVSGFNYVAYLFAHNAGGFGLTGTDNVISCGSYTGNGNSSGNLSVTLGYEPQYLLVKKTAGTIGANESDWVVYDNMRSLAASPNTAFALYPNIAVSENALTGQVTANATGFTLFTNSTLVNEFGATYIYIAIRRPNKPPTSGTSVFSPNTTTNDSVEVTTNFPVDLLMEGKRTGTTYQVSVANRLVGGTAALVTSNTNAEYTGGSALFGNTTMFANNIGIRPAEFGSGSSVVLWNFRRAPGFFDEVCYTGNNATNRQVTHNLNAEPELMIVKSRTGVDDWIVRWSGNTSNNGRLNSNLSFSQPNYINGQSSTFFQLANNSSQVNNSAFTYVAYLFATCPGVSKVFSYTGNGTIQTINCGFTTGARFVLIKRIDNTGDWYVWDSARGIVAGNDPHLSLNTDAAEVTTDDSVDTDTTGFIVNQLAATNVNVTSATYIGLAIA